MSVYTSTGTHSSPITIEQDCTVYPGKDRTLTLCLARNFEGRRHFAAEGVVKRGSFKYLKIFFFYGGNFS